MTPSEAGKMSNACSFDSDKDIEDLLAHLRSTIDFLNGRYESPDLTLALNMKRVELECKLDYRKACQPK